MTDARSGTTFARPAGEQVTWLVIDSRTTCLIDGSQTGGQYSLFRIEAPEGGGPPPHLHSREDETFYVLDGELILFSAAGEVTVGPGAVANLPRGELHTYRGGRGGATFLMFARPAGIEAMFAELHDICSGCGEPDMAAVVAAIERQGILIPPPPG